MTFNETNSNIPNLLSRVSMAVSFGCICILGVIGNLIVLIVAFRKQNYRFVTNCYIINLAVTDLLFLLISVPLTTHVGLTNSWLLNGIVSCRIHIYLAHVLLQATCYTLAIMSIDRYLYVISSHPRPRWRTPLNACIICILIWAVSIASIFPYPSLSSSNDTAKNSSNDCSLSNYHPLFASCFFPFCAYYVLPLLIIALCYTRLFFYMRKSSKIVTRYRSCSLLNRPSAPLQRHRVTRTLVSLTCAFAVCWLPIHILELFNCRKMLETFYINHPSLLEATRIIAHALSYFNSCLNPFLYALFNKEFVL